MKALAIARVSVLRSLRDRMDVFFIVVLPMILIVVLGMTYGGMSSARLGVADLDGTTLSGDLVGSITTTDLKLDVRHYGSEADLRDAVERGYVELGLVIPAGYEAGLRGGSNVTVEYVAQPTSAASTVQAAVEAAVASQNRIAFAARFTARATGLSIDRALAAARSTSAVVPGVSVDMTSVGTVSSNPNGYAQGSESMVILFMFLTSLTGATVLVTTRELGISRREFATPTSARTIILGEALGRFGFALFQGGFIVAASALLFGVDWIDPVATAAIIVAFALVATGAAMVIGALAANNHQVAAFGPALGMLFGLFGGTMVPLEVFPDIMRDLARATPHAWAMDAFHKLLLDGPGVAQVLPDVAVLLAFAAGLLALAVVSFRRVIVGGVR